MYKYVRIRIEAGYEWGRGWSSEQAQEFYPEIKSIFNELGFTEKEEEFEISCAGPTMEKGFSNLYIHPMEITGALDEDLIKIVCDKLKPGGDTFSFVSVYVGDKLEPWTEDDEIAYYESIKEHIKDSLRIAFEARCINKEYALDTVIDRYTVKTVYRHLCSSSLDPVAKQVRTCFKELLDSGEIEGDYEKGFIYVGDKNSKA